MLTDEILERLLLSPRDDERSFKITPCPKLRDIQPASVDLHLGAEFMTQRLSDLKQPEAGAVQVISDPAKGEFAPMEKKTAEDYIELPPMTFALATTKEWVRMSDKYAGRVEGRSTLGRLGLTVHATAGFIDPGFEGNITLELFNLSFHKIRLRVGMSICQIAVEELNGSVLRPYGHTERQSRYKGQTGVQGALRLGGVTRVTRGLI